MPLIDFDEIKTYQPLRRYLIRIWEKAVFKGCLVWHGHFFGTPCIVTWQKIQAITHKNSFTTAPHSRTVRNLATVASAAPFIKSLVRVIHYPKKLPVCHPASQMTALPSLLGKANSVTHSLNDICQAFFSFKRPLVSFVLGSPWFSDLMKIFNWLQMGADEVVLKRDAISVCTPMLLTKISHAYGI